jgi:acyl carrier protein
MDPNLEAFSKELKKIHLRSPRLPFASNVTGGWITEAEATDPTYWVRQLRGTVRFADGLARVIQAGRSPVLLEVGPGQVLCTLARRHPAIRPTQATVPSVRHPKDATDDAAFLMGSLGRLWLAGADIDWAGFYVRERRRRIPLPTYPFERTRHWVQPGEAAGSPLGGAVVSSARVSPPAPRERASDAGTGAGERPQRLLREIRAILSELSGLSEGHIDPGASFLSLGFDSLILTQACTAVQRRLGVTVKLAQLIEQSSPRALAEHLDRVLPAGAFPEPEPLPDASQTLVDTAGGVERSEPLGQSLTEQLARMSAELKLLRAEVATLARKLGDGATCGLGEAGASQSSAPPTPRVDRSEPPPGEVPLTDGQQEIWLATQFGDDASCAFNLSNTVRLKGPLDVERLRAAIQALVNRHEALRATFDANGLTQRIAPSATLEVPLVDLSRLGPDERAVRLSALRLEESQTPFDISKGPMVRSRILKLGQDDHLLFLTVHHIVCDGWSCGVLVRDLSRLYSESSHGSEASGPASMQFSEYVDWYKQMKGSSREADAVAYWLKEFSDGAPVLDLPTDRPRPPERTYNAAREALRFDKALSSSIKQAATRQGATLFAFLLCGFEALLHRLTGQADLVIGVSVAGQALVGGRDLIGHCVNFLPLRMEADDDDVFAERLQAVRRKVLEGLEHQLCSFGTLLRKLKLPRDPSRVPLISVAFNIRAGTQGVSFEGLEAEIDSNPRRFESFELFANVVEIRGCLEMQWTYNTDLFDGATVRRWLRQYRSLLASVVADPGRRLHELGLSTEAARRS